MTLPTHWVNGRPGDTVSVGDRGFRYGDGLFETFRIHRGKAHLWRWHLDRLQAGLQALAIECDPVRIESQLAQGLDWLQSQRIEDAAARLSVSRGESGRGYSGESQVATLALSLDSVSPWRSVPAAAEVVLCETPLAIQPALAGIKHGNRLEQVLAARELHYHQADEGLQCNTRGELVCGISSNLFVAREGELLTPPIVDSGISGTVRRVILEVLVEEAGLSASETVLYPHDLSNADEMFLTNSLQGIRAVARCGAHAFTSTRCGDTLREHFFRFSESSE